MSIRRPQPPRGCEGQCDRCSEPGIGYNDDGVFLCEDCIFEEAAEQAMPDIVAGREPHSR